MVKETFSNVIEKYGFLTGDPHFHDGGTSKRTGKDYAAFSYMFYLPINQEETVRIDMRAILNTVFKYALHEYWVNENPCSRIDFRIYGNMLVESTNVKYRVTF